MIHAAPIPVDPETDRIRAIVRRHAFPAFVTGFDIRFGEDFDMPVVLVAFKTIGLPDDTDEAISTRAVALHEFRLAVQADLRSEVEDLSPRFLFERAEETAGH